MLNTIKINYQQLYDNLAAVRRSIPPGCGIAAVIKGNGYGHGMLTIARALDCLAEVTMLVVCSMDEAMALFLDGIRKPVLILNRSFSRQTVSALETLSPEEAGAAIRQFHFSVYSPEDLEVFRNLRQRFGTVFSVQIRLDFFGGLRGVDQQQFEALRPLLPAMDSLRITGIYAHIYSAYQDKPVRTKADVLTYAEVFDSLDPEFRRGLTLHMHASASCFRYPQHTYDMVRVGALLYGFAVPGPADIVPKVRGILSIEGQVLRVAVARKGMEFDYNGPLPDGVERVALLSFGNWDFPFLTRCKDPPVYIRGHRCRIIGLPCMDSCCADITGLDDIADMDTAVLLGDADGIRFDDWVARSDLEYGDCQMILSGMDRVTKEVLQ